MDLSREQQTREAVLQLFCDPPTTRCRLLEELSRGEWARLLIWLDTSGLALYFLDRVEQLRLTRLLPLPVLARLQKNLADNTVRMRSLMAESIAIHREFELANVSHVLLKGFSLCPHSVPRPELRSQLDLDFLVAEKSMPDARSIVEHRGYRLRAVSGKSWEFKTDCIPSDSLMDLYKNVPFRSVELHAEVVAAGQVSRLASPELRLMDGIGLPVLPPADLFLGQGMHLFKHVCSEFFRPAHLLEFRRHVVARRFDSAFWAAVRSRAEASPRACVSLGVVTLLISRTMGDFAPEAFTSWTVGRLPAPIRLWIELYGTRAVLAGFPGSKMYLFLEREIDSAGVPAKRSLRRALLPLKLPPVIAKATTHETAWSRFLRYRMQMRFILMRLRFHAVEGLRFGLEQRRWRRMRADAMVPARAASPTQQSNDNSLTAA